MEGSEQQFSSVGGSSLTNVPLFITAAHELKSPLALMRQLSLCLEADDCSPADIKRLSRQITLTSERALRLTVDLTRTSRLDDSLFSLEPLNPVSVCDEVVQELKPLYGAKGRSIVLASRSRPMLALANRDLLRRILLNFADNALHYSDSETPVVVSAVQTKNGDEIRLGVRDYGPALPTNVWNKLRQGESDSGTVPLHNRPESSGLGIYIANQFAEAMNARIGATRHRDGATFFVDISASTQMRLL